MRVSKMVLWFLPVLMVLSVSAVPASAQEVSAVELSGGWQLIRVGELFEDEAEVVPAGWYVDVAGNVTRMLAIVGQVGGNYKSIDVFFDEVDAKAHEFLGGVRVSSRANARVVPFGQFLVGATRFRADSDLLGIDESETDFALQVGGGVNLMATDRIGIRVGADYLRVFSEDEGTNVFRFVAGVVLPFGMR